MECPKCKYIRQETDSIVPDWQCPQCGIVYAKVRQPPPPPPPPVVIKSIMIRMASGQEFSVEKIKLYQLGFVQQFNNIMRSVGNLSAGFSTGIGFWGDLQWVATGSIIKGLVEGAVSNAMQDQATQNRVVAIGLAKTIRETAIFTNVSIINNIKYPDPTLWTCRALIDRKAIDLIHIPSDYFFIDVDGKETAIFFDKIERYEVTST